MGPTWGQPGAEMTQVGLMLSPWILLSGLPSTTVMQTLFGFSWNKEIENNMQSIENTTIPDIWIHADTNTTSWFRIFIKEYLRQYRISVQLSNSRAIFVSMWVSIGRRRWKGDIDIKVIDCSLLQLIRIVYFDHIFRPKDVVLSAMRWWQIRHHFCLHSLDILIRFP